MSSKGRSLLWRLLFHSVMSLVRDGSRDCGFYDFSKTFWGPRAL